jgi:hypothetical protein
MSDNKKYSVFRKAFHIPSMWANNTNIKFLVQHEYATKDTKETLKEIHTRLSAEGYADDNDRMIHDYLHYMIMDLLDKNGIIYITENDIKNNKDIKDFLLGTTPDLIIQGNETRKRLIVDVYIGDKKDNNVKSKYKSLELFSKFVLINKHAFADVLVKNKILPKKDAIYLHDNFQIFLIEYYYWRSCIKLGKVIFNDVPNNTIQEFIKSEDNEERTKFILNIEQFAYASKF